MSLRSLSIIALVSLAMLAGPAGGEEKPGGLKKDYAEKVAAALKAAMPPAPKGWRVATGAIYGERAEAADQGTISAWRWLPKAIRYYEQGGTRIHVEAWYVPPAWVARKRRQLRFFQEKTPHCVTELSIKTREAWLLGNFKKAPEGASACIGAQLVVISGAVMLTIKGEERHAGIMKALAARFGYARVEKLEME